MFNRTGPRPRAAETSTARMHYPPRHNPLPPSSQRFAAPANGTVARDVVTTFIATNDDAAVQLAARMQAGLELLDRAYQAAVDIDCDPWEMAVEIADLRRAGLSLTDLRWLVRKGFAQHAQEVTQPGEEQRAFHSPRGVAFTRRTCLMLTGQGATLLRQTASLPRPPLSVAAPAIARADLPQSSAAPQCEPLPHWDGDLMELRVGGQLVKQFKVPAPNQEMVLSAFEEEGWPARIDDPLPPVPDQDSKRRLHDTINSLNRNQKQPLIRFLGDGSGQGVRWVAGSRVQG